MTPEIAPPKRSLNPVSIVLGVGVSRPTLGLSVRGISGSVLKEGTKVCQRQLVNEMFGRLITEFARNLSGEAAHLFSAASNPAFSVASRPSNSSDITRTPTSQRRPSARWSPVEHTRFKVVPANSTWRVTGSSCRIAELTVFVPCQRTKGLPLPLLGIAVEVIE